MGKGARDCQTETERGQHAEKEDDVRRRPEEDCRSPTTEMGEGEGCPEEVRVRRHLGSRWESSHQQSYTETAKRSPTCPPLTVGGGATGLTPTVRSPPSQVVDASCGNKHCIALRHSCLRPRVEQPRTYPKIAKRVHRLKVGQHFDVPGIGTDERSRNRFRSGLYAAARLDKVSVRGLSDGSVRITKVGEWSSLRV